MLDCERGLQRDKSICFPIGAGTWDEDGAKDKLATACAASSSLKIELSVILSTVWHLLSPSMCIMPCGDFISEMSMMCGELGPFSGLAGGEDKIAGGEDKMMLPASSASKRSGHSICTHGVAGGGAGWARGASKRARGAREGGSGGGKGCA